MLRLAVTIKMLILLRVIKYITILLFASVYASNLYASPSAGEIGKIKGSGVLERGKDVVIGET